MEVISSSRTPQRRTRHVQRSRQPRRAHGLGGSGGRGFGREELRHRIFSFFYASAIPRGGTLRVGEGAVVFRDDSADRRVDAVGLGGTMVPVQLHPGTRGRGLRAFMGILRVSAKRWCMSPAPCGRPWRPGYLTRTREQQPPPIPESGQSRAASIPQSHTCHAQVRSSIVNDLTHGAAATKTSSAPLGIHCAPASPVLVCMPSAIETAPFDDAGPHRTNLAGAKPALPRGKSALSISYRDRVVSARGNGGQPQ